MSISCSPPVRAGGRWLNGLNVGRAGPRALGMNQAQKTFGMLPQHLVKHLQAVLEKARARVKKDKHLRPLGECSKKDAFRVTSVLIEHIWLGLFPSTETPVFGQRLWPLAVGDFADRLPQATSRDLHIPRWDGVLNGSTKDLRRLEVPTRVPGREAWRILAVSKWIPSLDKGNVRNYEGVSGSSDVLQNVWGKCVSWIATSTVSVSVSERQQYDCSFRGTRVVKKWLLMCVCVCFNLNVQAQSNSWFIHDVPT